MTVTWMRSKLFVPATRAERFAKALASAADQVSIDLEDSVLDEHKATAREQMRLFLHSPLAAQHASRLIVRVNAPGSPHLAADLEALAGSACTLINLPKVESADDVQQALALIDRACTAPTRLLCNIETPKGLRCALQIAQASPRVAGLQLGLADLFEHSGLQREQAANVHAAMFHLALSAAEAGVPAYDGAYPAVDDEAGFRAEASMARSLGFAGKSCIHPRQVPWANDAFTPSDTELGFARRIIEAAAAGHGGVFVLDGRMIDRPHVERAQALLARFGSNLDKTA